MEHWVERLLERARKHLRLITGLLALVFAATLMLWNNPVVAQTSAAAGTLYLPAVMNLDLSPSGGETLADGGVVTSDDGVKLGAVAGGLTAPLGVFINPIPAPSEPLFYGAAPLGNYYEIRASTDVNLPAGSPFILGLPVPAGSPTSTLGLAALLPDGHIWDPQATERAWRPMLGSYDSARGLFFVTLNGLTQNGFVFVLVDHPDLETLSSTAAAASPARPATTAFRVDCVGFASPSQCTSADELYVMTRLDTDYAQMVTAQNFKEPLLNLQIGGLDPVSGNPTASSYSEYFDIFLLPKANCVYGGSPYLGLYQAAIPDLTVCKDPAAPLGGAEIDRTIRHEFFHAVEYGYSNVYNNVQDTWIIEGLAATAELSNTSMMRTPDFELHKVDVSLSAGEHVYVSGGNVITNTLTGYEAQDFWVFTGIERGEGLDYVQPMFGQGARTQDAVDTFGDGEYLPIYWDWVKNQVMEKGENFNNALGAPCTLEHPVVHEIHVFNHHWDHPDGHFYEVMLGPLTTAVIQVVFDYNYDLAAGYVFPVDPNTRTEALLAQDHKFYKDGESGCDGVPDGDRIYQDVKTSDTYYVIISNSDKDDSYLYRVLFEVDPIPGQ